MRIKTYILIIILAAVLVNEQTTAQRFLGAVMGGMNISQIDGDEVFGYRRVGAHFGVAAILPLKNWDVTLETVFNMKGASQKPQYVYDSLTGEYDVRLNYVEIPVLVHYTDKKFIGGGVGFSYGRLVNAKEVEHGGNVPPYADSVPFKKSDWNILVDAQIRIWQRLKFNVRFAYSLAPIRERTFYPIQTGDPWTRKQYNHLITFRLVYVFNEEIERKVPSQ